MCYNVTMIETDEKEQARTEGAEDGKSGRPTAGEFVGISVKAAAVELSIVMLILSILTVAMPLSAMRVFNKLGMESRALYSGGRYISSRLDKYDADETDELGNYVKLNGTGELSDENMLESLNVCINLSDKLIDKNAGKKKQTESVKNKTKRYAERLEKYTRMYASLSDVRQINADRDKAAVASFPKNPELHSFVYDYAHTNMVLNYRARVYTGETDYMLYDSGHGGDSVQSLSNRALTYNGLVNKNTVTNIDGFVDYIGQLGAYLDIKLTEMGAMENPVPQETYVAEHLKDVMDGTEFELFADKINGYTFVYTNLECFTEYATAAYEYAPQTLDDRLHQVFWLREFSTVATRLYYLGMLLYYNQDSYGQKAYEIGQEYDNLHSMCYIYDNTKHLNLAYEEKLNEYITEYNKTYS